MKHYILLIYSILFLMIGCQRQIDTTRYLSGNSFNSLSLETVFEFTDSEEVTLQQISSIKMDKHGNILIHDFRQPFLFMFNQEGRFLKRIGNEGRGPGEFQLISSFMVDSDSLWVVDASSFKIEKFEYRNGDYDHINTISLGRSELAGVLLGKADEGILILNRFILSAGSPNNPSVYQVTLVNDNGKILRDAILTLPIPEQMTLQAAGNTFYTGKVFGNKSLVAFDGLSHIYTLWTDSLSLDSYTTEGVRQHAFSYSLQPVQIANEERDSVSNGYGPYRSDLLRKLPDVKPIVKNLHIDDNQRIWVELLTKGLGHAWFSFSEEGEPLYKIDIPRSGAELQGISKDLVLWNYQNEKGSPTFVVSKIRTQMR